MIHYTCDCCKRELDPEVDLRYVVKLEVYASLDPLSSVPDDDSDHLEEIQDILERMDDAQDDRLGEDVYRQMRFDLCPECRQRFIKNPLAAVLRIGQRRHQQERVYAHRSEERSAEAFPLVEQIVWSGGRHGLLIVSLRARRPAAESPRGHPVLPPPAC